MISFISFWFKSLLIVFLIGMIITYAFYGNKVLKRMFKFGKEKNKETISSGSGSDKNSENEEKIEK